MPNYAPLKKEGCVLVVVDIQEKLLPAIHDFTSVLDRSVKMVTAAKALAVPEVRARLSGPLGIEVVGSTPEAFGGFLDTQMETWGRVVRENNIRPD